MAAWRWLLGVLMSRAMVVEVSVFLGGRVCLLSIWRRQRRSLALLSPKAIALLMAREFVSR